MKKLLIALALAYAPLAASQAYPSRPVKLVVPFPAGSATDQIARVVGQQLQESLGQPFVVENKPGAQGAIAATEVARAPADGYTLMVGTNTPLAANPSLFKKLNYDPVKDFAPIARLGTIPFMILVRPDFPAKDLKGFLAQARASAGKLSAGYGSAGSQVSQAMLRSMGKIDFIDVPYKGLPQAITDVLGGQISFTFADMANALAQIKGGKLRGIAVTSSKRSALAPEVPAIAEELPGYELIAWFALVAPANTPAPLVTRLHELTVKSLAKPEVKAR
ncbi:MAG TPA: tripartite tricarboxylate transporter substrate binding protein, partial [Burkholderiales bacterium]|nr:tripartite tricarboxylate transporter substrate binding protein [Burkholderiales bacterium]